MESNRYAETSHKDRSFQWIVRYDEFRLVTCLFRKVQIFISQSTDFHFAKYRFPFRKVQISISQITDFHFAKYRFPFRFVPFRFAKYNKPADCASPEQWWHKKPKTAKITKKHNGHTRGEFFLIILRKK